MNEIDTRTVRRLTWRLVPFLFLLYIVAYLDRINVGFAALQMRQQLALDGCRLWSWGGDVLRRLLLSPDSE